MLATAVTIGIGIAATSNASARDLYNSQRRGDAVRTYRPPAGRFTSAASETPARPNKRRIGTSSWTALTNNGGGMCRPPRARCG